MKQSHIKKNRTEPLDSATLRVSTPNGQVYPLLNQALRPMEHTKTVVFDSTSWLPCTTVCYLRVIMNQRTAAARYRKSRREKSLNPNPDHRHAVAVIWVDACTVANGSPRLVIVPCLYDACRERPPDTYRPLPPRATAHARGHSSARVLPCPPSQVP
jgi:hypothetical protein